LENFITESLYNNNLLINQPENGYRFSIDPFLLCSEIPVLTDQTILDIGCGSGVIPLILVSKYPEIKAYGIEIQHELASIAKENVIKNSMEQKISILCKDVKELTKQDFASKIDIIISNPPYKRINSGRLNPNPQKAIARHEISLNIEDFFICAARLLSKKGKVFIIFPANRIYDLLKNMDKNNIQPTIIKFIHTKKNHAAKLVIVSGIKNGLQQPSIMPPLYI